MAVAAQRQALPGGRWHFSHGPIDIVIGADGDVAAVQAAHQAAWQRFQPLLADLVTELPLLRRAVVPGLNPLQGDVARCMWQACAPLVAAADGFITPMAAVAGSVAQALIGCYQRPGVQRAWVNNGGDIALHLAPGQQLRIGLFADLARLDASAAMAAQAGQLPLDGHFTIDAGCGVAGVATSGWRGRSFSRGIADSVTVLARSAAYADAAATVVANAVDVDAPGICRAPASSLRDDSDLGDIPVTVQVPTLPLALVQQALARGAACAQDLQRLGLIVGAGLLCQGQALWVPPVPTLASTLRELQAA